MNQEQKGRELRKCLMAILRWSWFLALCVVVAGTGAFVFSTLQPPVYRATALMVVDQRAAGQDRYSDVLASNQLATTYASLISQPVVVQEAASRVTGISARALASRLRVSAQAGTEIIQVQVDDTSADLAAALANAVSTAASDRLAMEDLATPDQIHIFEPAMPPSAPDHPHPLTYTAIGATLGLIVAVCVALLLEYLDPRIRTAEDVEELTGLPTVGSVEAIARHGGLPTGSESNPRTTSSPLHIGVENTRLAECMRILRTNLGFAGIERPLRTIVVTSPVSGDGKTTLAINLAISFARASKRVLLVDADLRHPQIHTNLGLPNTQGLSNCLAEEGLRDNRTIPAVSVPDVARLLVLTAGPTPAYPTELLGCEAMRRLTDSALGIGEQGGLVDVVVLDAPPALAEADASVLAGYADGTILVVDAARARKERVVHAMEVLKRAHARIVGVVPNRVSQKHGAGSYYIRTPASAGVADGQLRVRSDRAVLVRDTGG